MSEVPSTLPESLIADLRKWESEGHLEDYEPKHSPLTYLLNHPLWTLIGISAIAVPLVLGSMIVPHLPPNTAIFYCVIYILAIPFLAAAPLDLLFAGFIAKESIIVPILNWFYQLNNDCKDCRNHFERHLNSNSIQPGLNGNEEFVRYNDLKIRWNSEGAYLEPAKQFCLINLFGDSSAGIGNLSKLFLIETLHSKVPVKQQTSWEKIAPNAFSLFCSIHEIDIQNYVIDQQRSSQKSLRPT